MTLKKHLKSIYQVDAFTNEAFKGNPAGVVIVDDSIETNFMQQFAAEMNLSETAFVSSGDGFFNIRYFTPYSEVPLCGHASLAAAHVLYDQNIVEADSIINFKTPKYDISFTKEADTLIMQFPTYKIKEIDIPEGFSNITGLTPNSLYKSEHGMYLAYFESHIDVHRAHPHVGHMKHSDFGSLIITSKSAKGENCDFIYRFFAPALGIDEDPVTGSAQCALAPFWKMQTGKTSFKSFQASKRTGHLETTYIDDTTIQIKGKAITVFEGKLKI